MKSILLFLLLLPVISIAQDILPNANAIVVKGVTFQEVCIRLLDSGYAIEKKDEQLQTIRTEPKRYPKHWNAGYVMNIRIKDSSAFISGTFTAPFEQPLTAAGAKQDPLWNGDPVYNFTKKGKTYPKSLMGYPFTLMNQFAKSFGKPVEYLKQ